MKINIKALTTVYVIMIFTSCHENINHKLEMADGCLNRNSVDSAYNILKHINPDNLNGDENIALYTLLNTKTKYIKYIPVKNDSIDYAIFYYKQNGPEGRLAEAYNYKAMTLYYDRGKKKEAIEYLKKAEEIALKTDDAKLIQKIDDNIYTINLWCNHYNIALEYGFKALSYAKINKDTFSIAHDLVYIGDAYAQLNMNNKAMEYHLKAIPYSKYYDKKSLSILLGNIADYYFEKGNIQKAEEFINKAIQKNPTAYIYSVVADIYIEKGKYAEAEEIMSKAPKTTNDFELLKKLSTQYDLNRKSKNYVKALNIADSIIELNKKIDNAKENDNLNDIQAKYNREMMAQNFKSQIIYMIGGLLLLSLLIILLIFRQKYRNSKIKHGIIENRLLINEYKKRISEMENAKDHSISKISNLEQKINVLEDKESKTLYNGKLCYESILDNNTIVNWSAKDLNDFVDYYKYKDLPFVSSLDDEYKNLSPKQYLYLIMVNAMNKDDATAEKIMGISNVTIRSIKSRIKAKKVYHPSV
ncbi:tetratricopeptide repeat protein [Prevotella sp.]|uniref:tetratricopeptide repeat protein n=1 Tax=Prevotella sp. TaxID=59823 RepID=UPI003DA3F9FD